MNLHLNQLTICVNSRHTYLCRIMQAGPSCGIWPYCATHVSLRNISMPWKLRNHGNTLIFINLQPFTCCLFSLSSLPWVATTIPLGNQTISLPRWFGSRSKMPNWVPGQWGLSPFVGFQCLVFGFAVLHYGPNSVTKKYDLYKLA